MLKGAIFDHDGLMFDTEKVWQANWKKEADKLGIELPEEFKKEICGSSGQHMLDIIQKYYHVEDGSDIRARVRQGVADDEKKHLDMKEGLLDILDMFQKHGVKMAVASSSGKEMIETNLKNAHVEQYFDAVVSGQEVEHGKPAPDIFLQSHTDYTTFLRAASLPVPGRPPGLPAPHPGIPAPETAG